MVFNVFLIGIKSVTFGAVPEGQSTNSTCMVVVANISESDPVKITMRNENTGIELNQSSYIPNGSEIMATFYVPEFITNHVLNCTLTENDEKVSKSVIIGKHFLSV